MKHLCTGGDSNGPVLQSHQHAHVEVKTLPIDVLAKHGYTAEQISAIKNFNGSEAQTLNTAMQPYPTTSALA